MEIDSKEIFQIDSDVVKANYTHGLNYKVQYSTDEMCTKNLCVIYFSSNEIYYPNTQAAFENAISKRDKYEWERSLYPNAYKHIFVRDIQKQWYIEGINSKVNTPEKLVELLQVETNGYSIITIGSSAGGYAAFVYGSLLKAERVYAFNAQLDLFLVVKESTYSINPLLYKYEKTDRSLYFRADNFIQKETDYFYFQSSLSEFDISQYESFSKKGDIYKLSFKTSNHGFPFFRHNLSYILALDKSELLKLATKEIHPFWFSVKIDGFMKSILLITKAVIKRIKKKMYDEKKNK